MGQRKTFFFKDKNSDSYCFLFLASLKASRVSFQASSDVLKHLKQDSSLIIFFLYTDFTAEAIRVPSLITAIKYLPTKKLKEKGKNSK